MPTHPAAFALERFLPYRLAVLANDVSRALGDVYGDRFELTIPEWRIIANLGHAGSLYAGELAERSNMEKPKVTRALQRLEKSGCVVRAIDVEDRRQARLSLTRKGQQLYANVAKMASSWEAELLSPLDANERKVFEQCLVKLAKKANEMRSYSHAKTTRSTAKRGEKS
jgi:DNA-binding MarR family transcriptional regulator